MRPASSSAPPDRIGLVHHVGWDGWLWLRARPLCILIARLKLNGFAELPPVRSPRRHVVHCAP
jgi:hypothetical protein